MGWLKVVNGLFTLINTIFSMIKEKELRQQGYKKAKEEVEKRKVENSEISNEIDSNNDIDDPWNKL